MCFTWEVALCREHGSINCIWDPEQIQLCLLNCGLKTTWSSHQTPVCDIHLQKEESNWPSKESMSPALNRYHMTCASLFHTVGSQRFVVFFFTFARACPLCSHPMEQLILRGGQISLNQTTLQSEDQLTPWNHGFHSAVLCWELFGSFSQEFRFPCKNGS